MLHASLVLLQTKGHKSDGSLWDGVPKLSSSRPINHGHTVFIAVARGRRRKQDKSEKEVKAISQALPFENVQQAYHESICTVPTMR